MWVKTNHFIFAVHAMPVENNFLPLLYYVYFLLHAVPRVRVFIFDIILFL